MSQGIIVFGANGSGKTTLGRELARVLNFRHMDHEDYAFEKSEIPYTAERSYADCLSLMLADMEKYGSFVLSAVTGDFGDAISQSYKLAIWICASKELRIKRVEQRAHERHGARIRPGGDMYEQHLKFMDFVSSRPLSRIDQWAKTLACPVLRVDGAADYKATAAEIANYYTARVISIGLPAFPNNAEVVRRVSARGVCVHDGKALMIKYKWPGYGFPGGGIESGESKEEAVIRELREEIGCMVVSVGSLILSVTERTTSESSPGKYFEQVNLFYECEVDDAIPYAPQPTQEEASREYASVWIDLREALRENEPIPQRKRDVAVLKMLLGAEDEA